MSRKNISKEKSIRRTKFLTELIVCAAVVGAGAYILKGVADRSETVGTTPYADITQVSVPDPEIPTDSSQSGGTIYETVSVPLTSIFKGDLILVNNDIEYIGGGENLVSILTMNDETDRHFFTSVDYDYKILDIVYEPMAQMIGDFYDLTSIDDLIIYGSYRTKEFQQQLYDADLLNTGNDESTRVAKAGYSEHETGYAFDFSTIPDYDFDGTGEYAWFAENCWKYGFILRYPENKEDITQIQYEPWHFRYVGVPHAYYMAKNGIVLEEYIELLKDYPYDPNGQQHLEFTDDDGKEYEVYYVAADFGAESANIPVPSGLKNSISGNNVDGFIVTVYKGEEPEPVTESDTGSDDDDSDISGDEENSGDEDTEE